MLDRIFAPLLTFVTLIAATVGFGSALLYTPPAETRLAQGMPQEVIVVLEKVEITARRQQPGTHTASQANEGRGVLLQRTRE